MVQTRSQNHSNAAAGSTSSNNTFKPKQTAKKTQKPDLSSQEDTQRKDEPTADKRKLDETQTQDTAEAQPPPKAPKPSEAPKRADEDARSETQDHAVPETTASKLHKVLEEYARSPLDGTPIEQPLKATPDVILAMVMDALLKSRPISHDLSQRAVNKLVEVGYHDIDRLKRSSWEERTMVLKDGGYNRYREQGATNLGDLAEWVVEQYDGDLNNLLKKADGRRDAVRALVKEVKGLGDLGIDLFLNNVQSVWPSMAPFLDARSLKTADEVGIGNDLDAIYAELKHDSMEMSRLANGLSAVRLDKKQHDIEVEG